MSFSYKTLVMVHLQQRLYLGHCIEIDTYQNYQGSTTKKVGKLTRKLEQLLDKTWYESDQR
jgi:hypothetical protein